MKIILDFLNKWGITITVTFLLLSLLSTCGVKSRVDRLDKKIQTLEQVIDHNDSLLMEKHRMEMEIYNLKVERSVLHNMNEIVLKNIRPADRISEIDEKLDQLNKQIK